MDEDGPCAERVNDIKLLIEAVPTFYYNKFVSEFKASNE